MKDEEALILFSGGIDSTTALYWARNIFSTCHSLIVDYGQKHRLEVEMAQKIAGNLRSPYHVINLPLKGIAKSALMDQETEIPKSLQKAKNQQGIPHTYVPFRNGIFLAFAAAYGEPRGITHLVTGFNLIDSPDYPDTTKIFTRKMEEAINHGTSAVVTGKKIKIHTPLIGKSKKEIIQMGLQLKADYSYSITCYNGMEKPCMACPSCEIRDQAFKQLNMEDPLITRLGKEEVL
jgi:7-cyano-7-deazaguanine synthase